MSLRDRILILLGVAAACTPLAVRSAAADLKTTTQDIPGTTVKIDLVLVPAGDISVADPAKPGSTTKVKVTPFWIEKTETTWEQYDAYGFGLEASGKNPAQAGAADAIAHPSKPYGAPDRGFGHQGYPVLSVTYYAAEQYCKWLSAKTGHTFRLPTEAEWEYACRAGKGDISKDKLADSAWFWQEKTQPVAKKLPNAWGIYDMLGNAGEWATGLDGKPVLCGGSYDDMAKNVTPSARKHQEPGWNATDPQNPKSKWWLSDGTFVGFRVIRTDVE